MFTGHLKLGIENGKVTSMQRNFYKINNDFQFPKGRDFDIQLKELEGRLNFGNLEYDFQFGNIVGMTASDYLKGDDLQGWLKANQFKAVKVVVIKSASV